MRGLAMVLCGMLAGSTAAAGADSRIEYKATEGGGAAGVILVGHGKVRSDIDTTVSVIIDPAAGTSTVLDHARKTFTRVGRAELDQLVKAIEDYAKKMEEALASAPPEMRDRMKAMMGGMQGMSTEVFAHVDTGERSTVAGKGCRIFRTQRQGATIAEYCLADISVLDLPAADRATVAAAMSWSQEVSSKLATGPMGRFADASPFRAGLIPLRTTMVRAGGERGTSEFAGVTADAVPADLFDVPPVYKEVKLEFPRTGRGGG